MAVRAPADILLVELPPVRCDVYMYLQKYMLHLYRYKMYFTCEDQKLKFNYICFA